METPVSAAVEVPSHSSSTPTATDAEKAVNKHLSESTEGSVDTQARADWSYNLFPTCLPTTQQPKMDGVRPPQGCPSMGESG